MPYQVFTAANIYIMAFWVLPLHRLLVGYKSPVKTFFLYRLNKSGFVPKPKFSFSLKLSATVTKPSRKLKSLGAAQSASWGQTVSLEWGAYYLTSFHRVAD